MHMQFHVFDLIQIGASKPKESDYMNMDASMKSKSL